MTIPLLPDDQHDRILRQYVKPSNWVNPTPLPRYQLVVIGGGPAGLVCAAAAAGLGAKVAMVERDLLDVFAFLERRELFHFDAHFANILTDGERLYLGDLGLATSPRFDLSPAEREFLEHNAGHDRVYVLAHLVRSLEIGRAHV